MRIQSLAVIFIIIILPISILLCSYTQARVKTLSLQTTVDSKLKDATYDSLKAYQINSFNTTTPADLANSKIRNIQASVNTFFNTMTTSFNTLGYTKDTFQNYIPALVYTMYDGFYIYSPFINTLDSETNNYINDMKIKYSKNGQVYDSYEDGKKLYGLKPYIYYSCRYKRDNNNDVIITYSLDNYVQIQGLVEGKTVSRYGYLLDNVRCSGNNIYYNDIKIDVEKSALCENVYVDGIYKENVPYIKLKGTKYYKDGNDVFSVVDGKKVITGDISVDKIDNNDNAVQYYKEAYELKQFIQNSYFLRTLNTSDIVYDGAVTVNYQNVGQVFDFDNGVEKETSNFNTHRIDVIKNTIEMNLTVAIANFNKYSEVTTNFQMPKLKDTDWDKIMQNISIISFMQGMNLGGKTYNGYAIVTNTKNDDVVMNDSIYIQTSDHVFHNISEIDLASKDIVNGVNNVNLERRKAENVDEHERYFYPVFGTLSYDSVVTHNKVYDKMPSLNGNLAKIYYTALGRERQALYRPKVEI